MNKHLRVGGSIVALLALGAALLPAAGAAPARRPKCMGRRATIVGTNRDDEIRGTKKRDVIVAKRGDDIIVGRGGGDLICAGGGNDAIAGNGGKDKIKGQGGSDLILGGGGADRLFGNGGADAIDGGRGNDFINGGGRNAPPFDVAIYSGATGPVTIDVPGGQASGNGVGTDTIRKVEDFDGSEFGDTMIGGDADWGDGFFGHGGNDTITGNGGPDFIQGGLGDDDMNGGTGIDTLDHNLPDPALATPVDVNLLTGQATGQGNDVVAAFEVVFGTMGNDTLTLANADGELDGLDGDDVLTGGSGADFLAGGGGNDTISGGAGDDVLDHYSWDAFWAPFLGFPSSPVMVDVAAGTSSGQGTDTFSGVEIVSGTTNDDTLDGSNDPDFLIGFDGDDTLNGLGGDDLLDADCAAAFGGPCPFGDGTADVVDGGDGNDVCAGGETTTNCEDVAMRMTTSRMRRSVAMRSWADAVARITLRSRYLR